MGCLHFAKKTFVMKDEKASESSRPRQNTMASLLSKPHFVFPTAFLLRAILVIYGLYQDAHSPMKYTDIDYFVFTDAAQFVSENRSPYARDTYRYTPLLAWILLPTTWDSSWFSFGKVLFAGGDMATGWLIAKILQDKVPPEKALKFACIWLLNPMVAQISTRGSSEGLLGVMVTALLWSVMRRKILVAGVLLGFAVHFKIYPFIYALSVFLWLDKEKSLTQRISSPSCIGVAAASFLTFMALNLAMYHLSVAPTNPK